MIGRWVHILGKTSRVGVTPANDTCRAINIDKSQIRSIMAKRFVLLKKRFMSRLRRPLVCKEVRKNKDELNEPIVDKKSERKRLMETSHQVTNNSCMNLFAGEKKHENNNLDKPEQIERDAFSITEVTEMDDCDKSMTNELQEQGEILETTPPMQARRPSSTVQRLKNLVKPKRRRYAICEEMEREIQTRGVSLRQYRKFLATSDILHDLKLL